MKICFLPMLFLFPFTLKAQVVNDGIAQISAGFGVMMLTEQQAKFIHSPFRRPSYEVITPKATKGYLTGHIHLRFNLKKWEARKQCISLGFPVSLSFLAEASTNSSGLPKENNNYFIGNLPFLLEYSFGQKAFYGAFTNSGFGGFVGAGGSYTVSVGKTGEFKTLAPHGVIGVRKNFGGKWTIELSYSTNFLPQVVDTGKTYENYDGAYFTDVSSFFSPKVWASTINLSTYFK